MRIFYLFLFVAAFSLRCVAQTAPSNDACSNATLLTVNATCIRGTTYGGSVQTSENTTPPCAGAAFTQTVWYKFTATNATMFLQLYADSFVGSGALWGPTYWAAAVYNSTTCPPTAASMIACQNSNSHGSGDRIIVDSLANLVVGRTYLVQVGYRTGSGSNLVPKYCISVGDRFTPICNTCANPCGPACGFSSNPSVSQVTSSCPNYPQSPYAEGNQRVSQCYTFTAVNSTVSFQVIVQSTCGSGNVTNFTWTLYRYGSCATAIQSGNINNLTFTGLTPGVRYVYCYTFNVPSNCYHITYWPYFVGAAPLPVELVSFTGEKSPKGIILKWVTASEVNNNYFLIQRSGDNADYTPIERVNGNGNSTVDHEYAVVDGNPLNGINYYQLIQVDVDGVEHEYGPVAVSETNHALSLLSPNPVSELATLNYFSDYDSQIEITIVDETGRLLFEKQASVTMGKNLIPLNTSFLSQGIYFLNISGEASMQHIRFVK